MGAQTRKEGFIIFALHKKLVGSKTQGSYIENKKVWPAFIFSFVLY